MNDKSAENAELHLEWRVGAPTKPWSEEWFIAETIWGDRVVLRSLPEEWTYDFKTADDTYIKHDKIKRWMQFPDSEFIAPDVVTAPAQAVGLSAIVKDCREAAKIYRERRDHRGLKHGDDVAAIYERIADSIERAAQPPAGPVETTSHNLATGERDNEETDSTYFHSAGNAGLRAALQDIVTVIPPNQGGTQGAIRRTAVAALETFPLVVGEPQGASATSAALIRVIDLLEDIEGEVCLSNELHRRACAVRGIPTSTLSRPESK
jgi:hypothetical protein